MSFCFNQLSEEEISERGLFTNGSSLPYNPKLLERARELRKNMTSAEKTLWKGVLSNKKFKHYRWLRQRPIDHFIVDFYCAKLKLIIEVDGESHEMQVDYDKERTSILEIYGVKVIRYKNEEVINNLDKVFLNLEKVTNERMVELGLNPP